MPSDDERDVAPGAAGPASDRFGPAGTGTASFPPRRLHPASIVLGTDARRAAQAIVPPVILGAGALGSEATALVAVAVVAMAVTWRVLAWQRFTYSFDGEFVRVEEGVLQRTRRSVDVGRIQQVELDRSLVARLLGVAVVRIETAGDASETEVSLAVVDERLGRALAASLRAAAVTRGAAAEVEPAGELIIAVPLRDVVVAAVTGSRLLVVPALVIGAVEWADQLGNRSDLLDLLRGLAGGAIVPLIVLALLASLAVAAAVGVIRDGEFRMERVGDELHVRRGLLATREATVPLSRVQMVTVERSWIRRPLRVAALRIHSAGGTDRDTERRIVVPLVADDGVDALVGHLLTGVPRVPELTAHPSAARRRLAVSWTLRLAILAAVVAWLAWPVGAAALAVVPPLAVLLATAEYRLLGHARTPEVVASRHGLVSTTTQLVPSGRVQGVSRSSTPLQRRLSLARLVVHVAGPARRLQVADLGTEASRRLWHDLRRA